MSVKNNLENVTSSGLIKTDRLRISENRKRFYFIIKILTFFILLFISFKYPQIEHYLHISTEQIRIIAFWVLSNIVITIIRLILVNLYIKRNNLKDDDRDNFILGVDRIASLLTVFFFVISFFYFFDINPHEFLTGISLVAVALVLVFKDYISNLLNGMIMMFSDQFHLNDNIRVGEFKGRIIDITLANVKIKTDDGELIYIPNTLVYLKEVVNYSKGSTSVVIVDFDLNMKLFGSLTKLESHIIEKVMEQFGNYTKPENVVLRVERIKKEEAIIKLVITLNKQNKRLEKILHRFCNYIIVQFIHQQLVPSSSETQS